MSYVDKLRLNCAWKIHKIKPGSMAELKLKKLITIHHTNSNPEHYLDSIDMLTKITNLHMQKRGWGDIGYHFLVDQAGLIFKGRDLGFQGAHVAGYNKNNIGIGIIGDFNVEKVSPELDDSLTGLLYAVIKDFDLSKEKIYPHSYFKKNKPGDCPGYFLNKWIGEFKR